jgi:hypothetical protein
MILETETRVWGFVGMKKRREVKSAPVGSGEPLKMTRHDGDLGVSSGTLSKTRVLVGVLFSFKAESRPVTTPSDDFRCRSAQPASVQHRLPPHPLAAVGVGQHGAKSPSRECDSAMCYESEGRHIAGQSPVVLALPRHNGRVEAPFRRRPARKRPPDSRPPRDSSRLRQSWNPFPAAWRPNSPCDVEVGGAAPIVTSDQTRLH